MSGRASLAVIAVVALAGSLGATAAHADPPPNDDPRAPGAFAPFVAAAGKPTELVAIGDLAEARPDAGVPPCFGPSSFKRTVWYRIPEVAAPQAITVEATGPTLNVIDLAAYVQPQVAVAPQPTPPPVQPTPAPSPESRSAPIATTAAANLFRPNVCDGVGAGGSDATEEPTSAVSLLVPANRPVLIQVGRRNRVSSAAADQVFLNLTDITQTNLGQPRGDVAAPNTRKLTDGDNSVPLAGATITDEDPAVPVCPSLGTVWRRYIPSATGTRLISAAGEDATTLAVFQGRKPTFDNVLDCVNRDTRGPMRMLVPVKRNKPLWVRLGADMTFGDEEANVNVRDGTGFRVIDGGEGGADPTFGGPGGGFPSYCNDAAAEDGSVTGPGFDTAAANFQALSRVPLTIRVQGVPLCDVLLTLVGPHGSTYASSRAISLSTGRQRITLARTATFTKGRYHLKTMALSSDFEPVRVDTSVSGRLRKK